MMFDNKSDDRDYIRHISKTSTIDDMNTEEKSHRKPCDKRDATWARRTFVLEVVNFYAISVHLSAVCNSRMDSQKTFD